MFSREKGDLAISDSSLMLLFKFSSRNKSLLWLTQAKEHELIGRMLAGYREARGQGKAGQAGLERRELKPGSRWRHLVLAGHWGRTQLQSF